jgi:hypothetical protein
MRLTLCFEAEASRNLSDNLDQILNLAGNDRMDRIEYEDELEYDWGTIGERLRGRVNEPTRTRFSLLGIRTIVLVLQSSIALVLELVLVLGICQLELYIKDRSPEG